MSKFATIVFLFVVNLVGATGGVSTYFNIYVPPSNDPNQNNVCLVVTALYDSTAFDIVDRGEDGDTDDSVSGMLMAGQSYVLYIRDNGVNDDSPGSGSGIQAQDGDHFIITSSQGVIAYQATDNDNQHDWVPSVNSQSFGEKFIIYSSGSHATNKDLNVFAFEDSTYLVVRKISTSLTQSTGYTTIDTLGGTEVLARNLNIGEDLIYSSTDGQALFEEGATYIVESNKPVSVQYGALDQRERDGGGYVTSSNGSSAGALFYFTVPYQAAFEQEIRMISWHDGNTVNLDRFENGSWVSMGNYSLDDMETAEWVGDDYNETHEKVFRVTCDSGKMVSVFEANWMETGNGNAGSYDMATMLSSSDGTSTGTRFLAYMAPPGKQTNVVDPFTGNEFGQRITHLYVFAKDSATVTIKDAYTNGSDFTETFVIGADGYADCNLTLSEWNSIYNGNGNPNSGNERPYLLVESTTPVSVMNTNFCDDWMMYFGSSMSASMNIGPSSESIVQTGDTLTMTHKIRFNTATDMTNPKAEVLVESGATVIECKLNNTTDNIETIGTVTTSTTVSKVELEPTYNFEPNKEYEVETKILVNDTYNDGSSVEDTTLLTTELKVSATNVDGDKEQTVTSESTQVMKTSIHVFFTEVTGLEITGNNNTWNASWIDFDGDNDQDLIVPQYENNTGTLLYRNDGGNFTLITTGDITSACSGLSVACADLDNDGDRDCFVAANAGSTNKLLMNNGDGSFSLNNNDASVTTIGYHHGASFADYDNDGFVDLFLCDFMPTKHNILLKNQGGTFQVVENDEIAMGLGRSIGATWADYDNDGDQDLFVPNGNLENNLFYVNNGDGSFTQETGTNITSDGANCVGSTWGDYDNDGDLDLFVANAGNAPNFLYKNNGDGTFTTVTNGEVVSSAGNSHGCSFVDFDNDGDLDLYVSNDQKLYENDGNGNFTSNTNELITEANDNAYGHAWADYDNDGDLDLYVTTHSGNSNHFYTNSSNGNHWFECKLVGTNSNKSGIGARVKVKANGKWQIREVNSQTGFGGQNSLVQHFGLGAATIIDSLVVNWPSGYKQTLTSINVDQIYSVVEDDAALLSGYVYNDLDTNCTKNSAENGIAGCKVTINPGNHVTYSNAQGYYSLRLAPGTYTLTQETPAYWATSTCFNPLPSVVITSISDNSTNNNISCLPQVLGTDLSVSGSHTALRKGFRNQFVVTYENEGTQDHAENSVVSVTFPEEVIPVSALPAWSSNLGNTYYWTIDTLGISEYGAIYIVDSTSIESTVGDFVNFQIDISDPISEIESGNNVIFVTEEIRGAIDPNDLLAFPDGAGEMHFIDKSQELRYKIRFQNVGNYAAQNIQVKNKISQNLDLESIRVISLSHQGILELNGNELLWRFDNINLPDSNSNEALSHGYIEYVINPKTECVNGSVIQNQAEITFDFEKPIITNKTYHTILDIGEYDSRAIVPIPNPSNGNVLLHSQDLTDVVAVELYTAIGQRLENVSFETDNLGVYLRAGFYANGIYHCKIISADNTIYHVRLSLYH